MQRLLSELRGGACGCGGGTRDGASQACRGAGQRVGGVSTIDKLGLIKAARLLIIDGHSFWLQDCACTVGLHVMLTDLPYFTDCFEQLNYISAIPRDRINR